ncbi:hypothetical protein QD336_00060 [Rhizobium sp. BR 250]
MAAGIACMLLSAGAVYVYKSGEFPFEILAAFLLSFVTWAFAEYKADQNGDAGTLLHPHDIKLANELRRLFTPRLRGLLRDFDFSNSFEFEAVEPLKVLQEWSGPAFEFENEELNRLLDAIIQISSEVYDQIVEEARPIERMARWEWWSFATDDERISDFYGKETFSKIFRINANTTKLFDALNDFERVFKRLAPASYAQNTEVDAQ